MQRLSLLIFIISIVILTGCHQAPAKTIYVPIDSRPAASLPVTPEPAAPDLLSLVFPTKTPVVAKVNGENILLTDYQRFVSQLPNQTSPSATTDEAALSAVNPQTLDALINQQMLVQIAARDGLSVSDEAVTEKMTAMQSQATDADFSAWLTRNQYTPESFREVLRTQMTLATLYQSLAEETPTTAPQIHVRQILVTDEATALDLLAQLDAGADFVLLATTYSHDDTSRSVGGDLGWIPSGLGLLPAQIESAALTLTQDQHSNVIATAQGYHLLKLVHPLKNRPLKPAHYQLYQVKLFEEWLSQQRASARIEQMVN